MESTLTATSFLLTTAFTIIIAGTTSIIAIISYRLTDNTEKTNHSNMIINLQDKLSAAMLQQHEIEWEYPDLVSGKKDFSVNKYPELVKMIESFTISYLDITNTIAYLFVTKTRCRKRSEFFLVRPFFTERFMLEKIHKKYFESDIAYAKELLELKKGSTGDDKFEYWQYLESYVEECTMKSNKRIPKLIKDYYPKPEQKENKK